MAIVKVKFTGESENYTMLFGDSYKSWQEQYGEYCRLYPELEPVYAWKSISRWIGWAGLKWCSEENFQQNLNREKCQDGDPDNPNPRKYSEMKFFEIPLPIIKR